MKKNLIALFLGFSILAMADTKVQTNDISTEIKDLNNLYRELVQKENARYKFEEKKAEVAKKEIVQLKQLKEKLEKVLANRKVEREKRFFKDDFDALIKKYQYYLEQVDTQIKINEKIVSEFNVIKDVNNK